VKRVPHDEPPFADPEELAPEANLESFRAVRRDSQEGHSIVASASLEERSSSKVCPQASHPYSKRGIVLPQQPRVSFSQTRAGIPEG
jgi:hypothetical protein